MEEKKKEKWKLDKLIILCRGCLETVYVSPSDNYCPRCKTFFDTRVDAKQSKEKD